jgi:peptidoglycan/xylan/chitin deacetylase (PgdA/CDA1 family)
MSSSLRHAFSYLALFSLVVSLTGCLEDDKPADADAGASGSSGASGTGGGSTGGTSGTSGTSGTGGTSAGGTGGGGTGGTSTGGGGTGGTTGGTGGGGTGGGGTGGTGAIDPGTCSRPDGMPAVTLTYDDALNSQLTTAAPSLRAHGLKATFFVTDVRSNPAPWAALRNDGHELAAHTFIHPCPKVNTWVAPGNANEDYDDARMATELDQSIAMLEMLGQPPPYTFAYPCGITWIGEDQHSYIPLIQQRFTAARGTSPGQIQAGVNLYNVPTTFSTGTGDALIALAEAAKANGTWVVYGFHGIGADSNVIDASYHEALLTYLDEQSDAIYVATFGELAACFTP